MTAADEARLRALGDALRAHAGRWSACDGSYDVEAARRDRHEAIARCHALHRARIPAYRRLADEAGARDDAPLALIAAGCAVSDGWFKSYDAEWLDRRDFARMGEWLSDVSAVRAPADAARASGVDEWLSALAAGGIEVLYSSGTSGKLSFVPRDEATWLAFRSNGPSYLLRRVVELELDFAKMEGVVLGFRGGRMGIQRAGVELSKFLPRMTYLYDQDVSADALRRALSPNSIEDALAARRSMGAGSDTARREAYARILDALVRATREGRSVYLFGAPYQVNELTALARAERVAPLLPGSAVNLGGGWKSFEGERVDATELAARIETALGVPRTHQLEAYAMVELCAPLMRCGAGRYHVPPILEPVLFDEALSPLPPSDDAVGTFGFLDPTALSYPGFIVTGDRLRLTTEPCACGLVGPSVLGDVRRAPGREVRGCGGILATVRA